MHFNRGFKAWAERSSLSIRRELGLAAHDPLSPERLAAYLDIELLTPSQIPGLPSECARQLLQVDPDGWSGTSFLMGDRAVIIYNPTHSLRRQASDKMHELAHFLIGHDPAEIVLSQDGKIVLRSYIEKQEDEANWLGGCLLLPREALLWIKQQAWDASTACKHFCVSEQLLRYRMNAGGVNLQVQRLMRYKKPLCRSL
jgi:hypothetical protein